MRTDVIDVEALNRSYKALSPIERIRRVFQEFDAEEILWTSSFGTTSGILLGMVSEVAPGHPLHFIDTTFCFKKTIAYKKQLEELFDLNIISVLPDVKQNLKSRVDNLWDKNPDLCCFLNKVSPFKPYKAGKKIWISGLMMNQTPFRENLKIFEKRAGILKMHPNIDTTEAEFEQYLIDNNIPPHPMKAEGYGSVGCTHCTVKAAGREGRWQGKAKQECGLHL